MNEAHRRDVLKAAAGSLVGLALLPDLGLAAQPKADGLKVGLIGAGRHGRAIIAELQKIEGLSIAAVCDSSESRVRGAVGRAAGAEGFADYRALLDKRTDVTAVIVATPTHLHKQIASDCLAAGRHVYCETPLAHTVEDARAIVQAARSASGLVFHAGFQARSNPVYKLARTFFRSDSVRELISMRSQHHQKTTWKTPASDAGSEKALNWQLDPEVSLGIAGELGSHQFEVFHWYRTRYPVEVTGHGAIRFHQDGRTMVDTAGCEFVFEDGARMHWEGTLANSFQGRHEVFHGSNAAIKLAWSHGWMFKEADAPTQGWEVYANRQQFHNDEGITLIADATKLASQGKLKEGVGLPFPSLYYALGDFVNSVTQGKPAACSAEDAMRSTVVAIMAAKAVAEGTRVMIDPELLK